MSVRIRTTWARLLSTTAALVAAGCGAGDAATPGAGCTPAEDVTVHLGTDGGTAIAVAAADDRFVPSCIELPAPGDVTLVVRNDGRHPHNATIGDAGVAVDAAQVAFLETEVAAGGAELVCTIHPGMTAQLVVRG